MGSELTLPHPEAIIVVPCIRVDPLTERCVRECRNHHPLTRIFVLADVGDGCGNIQDPLTDLIITGPITIAAKRNIAAKKSASALLAFIDSDAFPEVGWLENAVNLFRASPDLVAVGGPNIPPPDQSPSERWVGGALRSFLVSGPNAFRKRVSSARMVTDLPSCNLIVRRQFYLDLGGMKESLFTGEDMDFCARLVAAGNRILFSPDVLVFHKNRDLRNFVLQRLAYGASVPHLAREHNFNFGILTLTLPALFWIFLLSGPIALLYPPYGFLYWGVLVLYVVMLVTEAVRNAENKTDIPGTLVALIVGNLVPGLGTWAKVFGILPDLRRIYRNDGGTNRPRVDSSLLA